MCAGRLEVARRTLDRRARLGRGQDPAARLEHEADLKALEFRRSTEPIQLFIFETRIVARVGQRKRRHHERRVRDVARHRACDAADIGRVDRNSASARFQAENAAPAGRQANRPPDVGADMKRPVKRGRRSPSASRRAARIAVKLPGIARERMIAREAGGQHAVVGHGGLGEEDRAGFAQPRGRRRVGRFRRHFAGRGANGLRIAKGSDVVLDRRRHAIERTHRFALEPARLGGAGVRERAIRPIEISRGYVRLERFHTRDHRGHRLDRRQPPRPVGAQQFDSRQAERLHGLCRLSSHCHEMAERSLTKIGAFVHRPFSFASATVAFGNWNRKALTLSSAIFFCASPTAAL